MTIPCTLCLDLPDEFDEDWYDINMGGSRPFGILSGPARFASLPGLPPVGTKVVIDLPRATGDAIVAEVLVHIDKAGNGKITLFLTLDPDVDHDMPTLLNVLSENGWK